MCGSCAFLSILVLILDFLKFHYAEEGVIKGQFLQAGFFYLWLLHRYPGNIWEYL